MCSSPYRKETPVKKSSSKASPTLIPRKFKMLLLLLMDIVGILAMWYAALWMRYDFRVLQIPAEYVSAMATWIIPIIVLTILGMASLKLYNSIWSFFSMNELAYLLMMYPVLFALWGALYFLHVMNLPISVIITGTVLSFLWTAGIRSGYRLLRLSLKRASRKQSPQVRTMIIGAGSAGNQVYRELDADPKGKYEICCFVDRNHYKRGTYLNGVPVVGDRHRIGEAAKEYEIQEIIFAIPTAKARDRKEILEICQNETDCKISVIPGVAQMLDGEVRVSLIRPVDICDLLGRDNVKVNNDEIFRMLKGETVMVTGAGGSIGSELCRQIADCSPGMLVCFDIYENSIYDLQQELKRSYPDLNARFLIGSVRSKTRVNDVVGTYRPTIVFHAAAHKHVPLMENSPHEAIKNNVFGTYNVGNACIDYGVKKFVLISTDKAVNPTNIMGASKRLCEEVIQYLNSKSSKTNFVAVRFGNVLGSNGSVIPLFKKQIAAGGPVTVTHPDIIRYFMTIPEAVSLVLQAGFYAQGGQIFVLDMGEPVKIADMAKNLIKLSGFEPNVDIDVVYTGLRPGEKLYEELLMNEEGLKKTKNDLIFIGKQMPIDEDQFSSDLNTLWNSCNDEGSDIRAVVASLVDTYHYKIDRPIVRSAAAKPNIAAETSGTAVIDLKNLRGSEKVHVH